LLLVLAPTAAPAHPHIFIDGGVDFLFDGAGRIESLRVTWIYDPLNSLFMLEDLGIDASAPAPLAPDERTRLAAYQTEWVEGFDGDSYLFHDGARVGLSGPLEPDAELRAGQVVISFRRSVATPFRPDVSTVVEVYDPTYFTAYAVTEAPQLEGAPPGCSADVIPFRPTSALAALKERLLEIPIDADPEGEPGALFADRVRVTCD
jgi:ABC-type uncharacterized transport system substrate-binding protein